MAGGPQVLAAIDAALYGYDAGNNTWQNADGGLSKMGVIETAQDYIFQSQSVSNPTIQLATAITAESAYQRQTGTFHCFSISPSLLVGINFPSEEVAEHFAHTITTCIDNLVSGWKVGSGGVAAPATGSPSAESPADDGSSEVEQQRIAAEQQRIAAENARLEEESKRLAELNLQQQEAERQKAAAAAAPGKVPAPSPVKSSPVVAPASTSPTLPGGRPVPPSGAAPPAMAGKAPSKLPPGPPKTSLPTNPMPSASPGSLKVKPALESPTAAPSQFGNPKPIGKLPVGAFNPLAGPVKLPIAFAPRPTNSLDEPSFQSRDRSRPVSGEISLPRLVEEVQSIKVTQAKMQEQLSAIQEMMKMIINDLRGQ